MAAPNGYAIYHGPSRIDGAPIVALANGFVRPSENPKTGPMLQTWIMRADVSPMEALRTGEDVSYCGDCVHRYRIVNGKRRRSCYVNVRFAPRATWKAWNEGAYPSVAVQDLPALFSGHVVRLGAYGDPAAIPLAIWDAVLSKAAGWTGYTHQARASRLRDVLRYCQVSADSCQDAHAARAAGVGSFRVLRPGEKPEPWEMLCPASDEAGKRTTCMECQACSGFSGAHVVIAAHGIGKRAYAEPGRTRRPVSLPVLNPNRVRGTQSA